MIPLKRHRLMASRWQCEVIAAAAAALLKLSVAYDFSGRA